MEVETDRARGQLRLSGAWNNSIVSSDIWTIFQAGMCDEANCRLEGRGLEVETDRAGGQLRLQLRWVDRLLECSGFRVQGAGCRVQGSGFRVWCLWFRVEGLGLRVGG